MTQGKLEEALKAYREAVSIRERLVAGESGNKQWQRELTVPILAKALALSAAEPTAEPSPE